MAKVSFSKEELEAADQEAAVVFVVKGAHVKGFAFKNYSMETFAPPELAREAVLWFNAWSDRVTAARNAAAE